MGVGRMQLYIVRHGIAIDREDPKCPPDPERYLTEEGVEKTREVAKGVAAFGAAPDLFLSSPYVRAMQTAEIFAGVLEYSKHKIRRTDLLLPGGEPSLFFRELARDKQSSAVFCFGHAPQLAISFPPRSGQSINSRRLKKPGWACWNFRAYWR